MEDVMHPLRRMIPALLGLAIVLTALQARASTATAGGLQVVAQSPSWGGLCVNGSYPTIYGCTSGYAPYEYGYGYGSWWPYNNGYTGYNNWYSRYYNYPYSYSYNRYPYSWNYPNYGHTYPYGWRYCTRPGDGSVWVPFGASTAGLIC